MGRFSHTGFKDQMALEPGVVRVYIYVDTTTGGTIDTSRAKGATVVKTAAKTGRYTVTFDGAFKRLLAWGAGVEGAADAAYTDGAGADPMLRGVSPSTGVLYLQWRHPDTSADAEVEDAANFWAWFDIQTSSARG